MACGARGDRLAISHRPTVEGSTPSVRATSERDSPADRRIDRAVPLAKKRRAVISASSSSITHQSKGARHSKCAKCLPFWRGYGIVAYAQGKSTCPVPSGG